MQNLASIIFGRRFLKNILSFIHPKNHTFDHCPFTYQNKMSCEEGFNIDRIPKMPVYVHKMMGNEYTREHYYVFLRGIVERAFKFQV